MPAENTEQRKLAAILFTDMVGYSALAQRYEALALELLEEHRTLLRVLFPQTTMSSGSSHTGTQLYLAPELMAGEPATTQPGPNGRPARNRRASPALKRSRPRTRCRGPAGEP